MAFNSNGDAKAAGSIKAAVTAFAPDRSGISPPEESRGVGTYPDTVFGGSCNLTVMVFCLLIYDPSPDHANYSVELCYQDLVVDKGWYPR